MTMQPNPYLRPALETRADDERQLAALSLRDDHDFTAGAVAREFDETRNTILGWFNRIDAADAAAHGLAYAEEDDRRRAHIHRRQERAAVFALA